MLFRRSYYGASLQRIKPSGCSFKGSERCGARNAAQMGAQLTIRVRLGSLVLSLLVLGSSRYICDTVCATTTLRDSFVGSLATIVSSPDAPEEARLVVRSRRCTGAPPFLPRIPLQKDGHSPPTASVPTPALRHSHAASF